MWMQEHPIRYAFGEYIIQTIRLLLGCSSFCSRHKRRPQDFTRKGHFSFMNAVLLLLQKTVRATQQHLNEFFDRLGGPWQRVTGSAWCQARMKLSHTAFIEMNQKAILEPVYKSGSDFGPRRWRGHRINGIDSSLIHLPNNEQIGKEFGWVQCQNQSGDCGRNAQGRLSVLTDLQNRIALHTLLVRPDVGERSLAFEHLSQLEAGDITLMDRGYAGYELFARFTLARRL